MFLLFAVSNGAAAFFDEATLVVMTVAIWRLNKKAIFA